MHELREALAVLHLRAGGRDGFSLVDVLDDLDEFVGAVAVLAGVVDEVAGFLDDGAVFGCAGDGRCRGLPWASPRNSAS